MRTVTTAAYRDLFAVYCEARRDPAFGAASARQAPTPDDLPLLATPVRRRVRRPTLAGIARQAAKAGIEVAGYEVRPDGTVRVITGKPVEASAEDDPNSWSRVQ